MIEFGNSGKSSRSCMISRPTLPAIIGGNLFTHYAIKRTLFNVIITVHQSIESICSDFSDILIFLPIPALLKIVIFCR